MASVNYTCSCPSGFTGMLCETNTQGTSSVMAGFPTARSGLGTEPHTHRICQPLSVWLLRYWPSIRSYVSVYRLYGWGRGDYQRREGCLRRVSVNPRLLYLTFKICSIDSCQNGIATDRCHVSTHVRSSH